MVSKINFGFGMVLVVFFMGTGFCQNVPKAKEQIVTGIDGEYLLRSKMKSLLQLNFTFGYHHSAGKPVIHETLNRVSKKEGWEIKTITDPRSVTFDEINKYSAICANNISGWNKNQFSVVGKQAIQKFVEEEGKGVFGIHGSGDGQGGAWPWYDDTFHPIGYDGHVSPRVVAPVILEDEAEQHPIMEGVFGLEERLIYGEYYRNKIHVTESNPNVELLLKTDPDRCPGCYEPDHIHPEGNHIMWALPVGKGYHVFFPYGHDQREMDEFGSSEEWDRLFAQSFYYIAGYDSLKIGCMDPSNPKYDSNADIEYPTKADVCAVGVGSPTNFNFEIEFGKNLSFTVLTQDLYEVELISASGALLFHDSFVQKGEYKIQKKLESGLYFLKVVSSNGHNMVKRYLITH